MDVARLDTVADGMDFAALLEASLSGEGLSRGDNVTGAVLSVDGQGLIIDVGWKRDGIVSRRDIERLGMNPADFKVGDDIDVIILRLEDDDGNLLLSVSQARQGEDWKQAEALLNNG